MDSNQGIELKIVQLNQFSMYQSAIIFFHHTGDILDYICGSLKKSHARN